jgi:hypothetical protein
MAMASEAFIRLMRHPQAQNKFNVVYSTWKKNSFCVYDILGCHGNTPVQFLLKEGECLPS